MLTERLRTLLRRATRTWMPGPIDLATAWAEGRKRSRFEVSSLFLLTVVGAYVRELRPEMFPFVELLLLALAAGPAPKIREPVRPLLWVAAALFVVSARAAPIDEPWSPWRPMAWWVGALLAYGATQGSPTPLAGTRPSSGWARGTPVAICAVIAVATMTASIAVLARPADGTWAAEREHARLAVAAAGALLAAGMVALHRRELALLRTSTWRSLDTPAVVVETGTEASAYRDAPPSIQVPGTARALLIAQDVVHFDRWGGALAALLLTGAPVVGDAISRPSSPALPGDATISLRRSSVKGEAYTVEIDAGGRVRWLGKARVGTIGYAERHVVVDPAAFAILYANARATGGPPRRREIGSLAFPHLPTSMNGRRLAFTVAGGETTRTFSYDDLDCTRWTTTEVERDLCRLVPEVDRLADTDSWRAGGVARVADLTGSDQQLVRVTLDAEDADEVCASGEWRDDASCPFARDRTPRPTPYPMLPVWSSSHGTMLAVGLLDQPAVKRQLGAMSRRDATFIAYCLASIDDRSPELEVTRRGTWFKWRDVRVARISHCDVLDRPMLDLF